MQDRRGRWTNCYLASARATVERTLKPNPPLPELPDIENYIEAIDRHVTGQRLETTRLKSVFLVRSVEPPLSSLHGAVLKKT
ncbi:MAG: hypothetical protein KJO98_07025, partial [Rhodothermia bacterium]|nr:hypothetical protein [Rhodothermia bacterium]